MTPLLMSALVVTIAAIESIRRGYDVRLVLFLAGLVLVSAAGAWWEVFNAFQDMLAKGGIIGPICTAMGYAWVLRATGCDAHMVRLLVKPLRRFRWALIPGGCAVGFLANMAMTSQTACAAAVGPILLPLMMAAGYRPLVAGATLVVGCSIGGNLFNPGEPDIVTIHEASSWLVGSIIDRTVLPNLVSFGVATAVLTVMGMLGPRHTGDAVGEDDQPVDVLRALLAPLPVVLLLLLQPGLNLVPPLFAIYPRGVHVSTVMLVCTALVMVVAWRRPLREHTAQLTEAFFAGMGFGFTKVISLIIAAGCFIQGLKSVGAIEQVAALLTNDTALADVLSPLMTFGLAVTSGSGTAPSVSFSQAMVPVVAATDAVHAVDLGVLGAIGASIGRTMSPVAAIVLFTAALIDKRPTELVGLVKWPMFAALGAVIIVTLVF